MQTPISPASSPAPQAELQNNNLGVRKRQRSASMHSNDSSYSPKRAVSETPSNDGPSRAVQSDPQDVAMLDGSRSGGPPDPTQPATEPHLAASEKFSIVEQARKSPMEVGSTWYIVSWPWYRRWMKACTGEVDKDGPVAESDIGPVDNSHLVNQAGELISSTVEGVDVTYVPSDSWAQLVRWYGEATHPLPRKVIARGIAQEPSLELHPPRIRAMRLVAADDAATQDLADTPLRYITLSSTDTLEDLLNAAIHAFSPPPSSSPPASRLWSVPAPRTDPVEGGYSASRLLQVGGLQIQPSRKSLDEALVQSDDLFILELQENGRWLVDEALVPTIEPGTAETETVALEQPAPLFKPEEDFFTRVAKQAVNKILGDVTQRTNSSAAENVPSKAVVATNTSTRATKLKPPGTIGLGNLGNTCFMNSALQCLAHTRELVEYFLNGVYEEELNPDNPLGMGGAIAQAFGALLERMWGSPSASSSSSFSSTSISPREFKQALQRFAPQFSGYQQHDSQELVAFLLDGLHEDLNRILKKPYVEKPDWEGGGELELVQLAKKSWDGYLQRNDSVIVDLFQGQYRSTLVCPECQKVSITFDPFMYLTLPLPIKKKWKHTIFYVPADLSKRHVRVPVEIGADASFKELRALLGRWMEADPNKLLTLEEFSHRWYRVLDDNVICGEMAQNDNIWCFELPCVSYYNRPSSKRPEDGPFIIPVHFKAAKPPTRYGSHAQELFGMPTIVVIDKTTATSKEKIEEAVVDHLQRWTMNARDLYQWVGGSTDAMEEVAIPITGLPSVDSVAVTEIKENGEVIMLDDVPEEGDIVDQKSQIIEDTNDDSHGAAAREDDTPRRLGPKQGVFELLLSPDQANLASGTTYRSRGYQDWDERIEEAQQEALDGEDPVLLRPDDAFYLDFDENMRSYFFGDELSKWDQSTWNQWGHFVHPELQDASDDSGKKKDISIYDCLNEFTKEEQLGEDDLWYCPQCKKHQQATKKFDLWNAPDILVVHLKRFSNSRMLRDKIDAFVDFPVNGLSLEGMVQEREVAKHLQAQGVDVASVGLAELDEPLLYDLYAVDEHIGGLGGGHYRAYALNHENNEWYHFDDSFVSPAKAHESVNANAYLLFYKRRTSRPLGGKTYLKIQEARERQRQLQSAAKMASPVAPAAQLPTPPEEASPPASPTYSRPDAMGSLLGDIRSRSGSSSTSPELDRLPLQPLGVGGDSFDFPEPWSTRGSPSSSTGDDELDARSVPEDEAEAEVEVSEDEDMSGAAGPRSQLRQESQATDFDAIDL
ncbi:cysteine proteinase [Punctularia strigosozonata HHB-11173 SS5]|uniref:cysteine proteinase n=1 Tax=Punctularia strigosozonata (strain HHB-11173) TaxID=741275 RepID=UPI0004416379|nr:cysteine proteinase [Punctularia strigosozonata HHB-11173 SS5]EIN05985.1 cysteine proteinase [Punctularia strigosozonata HHB-11173 SS5]